VVIFEIYADGLISKEIFIGSHSPPLVASFSPSWALHDSCASARWCSAHCHQVTLLRRHSWRTAVAARGAPACSPTASIDDWHRLRARWGRAPGGASLIDETGRRWAATREGGAARRNEIALSTARDRKHKQSTPERHAARDPAHSCSCFFLYLGWVIITPA